VQNAGGEPIAYRGSASEPMVIPLREAGAPAAVASASAEEEDDDSGDARWFVALTLGGGAGWTSGGGEVTPKGSVGAGELAPAPLGHLAPEIGYFVNDGFMLSVQLRLQYVTGTTPQNAPAGATDCGNDGVCHGATAALAGFLRATWLWGRAGRLHPYLALTAGGGNIRHVATLKNVSTCGDAARPVPCRDTVAAGPVFAGAGAGLIWNATDSVALTLGLTALAGFPAFTAHADLNGGVAFEF